MPDINLKPDTLTAEVVKFSQSRLTTPVFLNSVPKSGTHLLLNIVRMFVPPEQFYNVQAIQYANMHEHLVAFDGRNPLLSWGHLSFSDGPAIELRRVRRILLVRDPYTWVLSRARFFLSDEFQGNLDIVKSGGLAVEDLLNMMIFGIYRKAPPLFEIWMYNAVAWLGAGVRLVRYEDLRRQLKDLESPAAESYFRDLLGDCGLEDWPADWRDRVRIGADPSHSGTARENLTGGGLALPDELPDMQKRLVEFAMPGLRALLGYA